MARFRVAVCGGGIGGLVTAVALGRYPDIDVTIYEAAARFSEVGAGMGVWPRVWKLLYSLGLTEDLERVALTEHLDDLVDSYIFRKADQPDAFDFHTLQTQGSFVHYHRPDLLQVLLDHLPGHFRTLFGHRLVHYTEDPSGAISLSFENGDSESCDVLLGADGIKSAVRRSLLTTRANKAKQEGFPDVANDLLSKIEPIWSGIVGYRTMVPMSSLREYRKAHPNIRLRFMEPDALPVMHMGKCSWAVAYPVAVGKYVNIGSYHESPGLYGTPYDGPWVVNVDKHEVLAKHAGWDEEFQVLLQCIGKVSRWSIHESPRLDTWSHGNVTLIGDAAHAMTPNQASGAGQAIEDGVMVATLLGHPKTNRENISTVLKIYDEIRRPVAESVQRGSFTNGRLFGLNIDGDSIENQPDRLPELAEAIHTNWNWAWNTTLDKDIATAIHKLEISCD